MAAVVPIAAALVGGYFNNKANKRSTKAQVQATSAATDYQKGRDTVADKRYDDQVAEEKRRYQQKWDAYQAYLADYNRRHGITTAGAPATSGTPSSMDPVAVAARATVSQPGYDAHAPQPTIRDLAPGAAPGMAPAPQPGPVEPGPAPMAAQTADVSTMPTIADTARWNEWEPYLTQGRAS